ncbi:acyltransferase family protein [Frondihabitans australicus]|uniref:Fucose 4-O-acetylase-like acetyltransferase n=1 Tax=Frondihabitans australicus TaxID=386892 RepID=A0A495IDX4_9MICO|nr:acyltransferase [Frondihabitans australicus]RKR73979.1 fucose 4-O-acetylase-like acetyltransferase [Frondihabitans australicus]
MNADAHRHAGAPAPADRSTDSRTALLAGRDLTVDLARASCVLLVVVVHLLMFAVSRTAAGALVVTAPLTHEPWFARATWFGQIMPLFFVVGGFASATAWASAERRGQDAGDYVRGRLLRLGRPAAAVFVFLAVGLGVATIAGAPPAILRTTAVGIGSPLWFLAAYGITQLFVPLMARLHRVNPWATLAVLATAGLLVDLGRHATGVTDFGLLNMVFVWLFVQQLGFVYASGWLERMPVAVLVAVPLACWALLVPMTRSGIWSADMLTDQNPPMTTLAVLGVAQLFLLRLFRPALARLMQTRAAQNVVFVVGSRGMTVYLWHLPLAVLLTGALVLVGAPLPVPGSPVWWASRIPMYAAVLALAFTVSLVVGRLERAPRPVPAGDRRPSLIVIAAAAVLTIVPPFVVMLDGLDLAWAVIGAVALPLAMWLLGRTRPQAAPTPICQDTPNRSATQA